MREKYWFKEWNKQLRLLCRAYYALKGLRDKKQIEELLKDIEEYWED